MTKHIHSPFHIIPEFFSPKTCEEIIETLGIKSPTYEIDGLTPIPHTQSVKGSRYDGLLNQMIDENLDAIEARYGGVVVGMDEPRMYQFFEDPKNPCVKHGCESAKFLRKKWVKIKDVDLVAFVFLKDFNGGVPLDPAFEVYGAKIEFPVYNFSLEPQRGTCVLFPAGPHFINAVSHVFAGSAEYIKFSLKLVVSQDENTGDVAWTYQPSNFPGTVTEWFFNEDGEG